MLKRPPYYQKRKGGGFPARRNKKSKLSIGITLLTPRYPAHKTKRPRSYYNAH